jgi:hypothetical protein
MDSAAVDFFANFMDLMIWLSFQKEGTTSPTSTMSATSSSDPPSKERVWLDVVRALDSNRSLAMLTSFTLSGNVHPTMDLPSDMINMEEDADPLPEKGQLPTIPGPSQNAGGSSPHAKSGTDNQVQHLPNPLHADFTTGLTKNHEMISLPPMFQPPSSHVTATVPSLPGTSATLHAPTGLMPRASEADVATSKSMLKDATAVDSMDVDMPGHGELLKPELMSASFKGPLHDPSLPQQIPPSRVNEMAPRTIAPLKADSNTRSPQGTPQVGGTIEYQSTSDRPKSLRVDGAVGSVLPVIVGVDNGVRSAPAQGLFGQTSHQLDRSTSVELPRHECAPQHRFSSAPPYNIIPDIPNIPQALKPPTPVAVNDPLPPLGALTLGPLPLGPRSSSSVVVEISGPKATGSSDSMPSSNPEGEHRSSSGKNTVSSSFASQGHKGKGKQHEIDTDVSNDSSGSDVLKASISGKSAALSKSSVPPQPKGRGRQHAVASDSSNDGSSNSDSDASLTSAPPKEQGNSSLSISLPATRKAPTSRRLKAQKSRVVLDSEDKEDEHARATFKTSSNLSSQISKAKKSATASKNATPGPSNLKKKGEGKRLPPDATGKLKLPLYRQKLESYL